MHRNYKQDEGHHGMESKTGYISLIVLIKYIKFICHRKLKTANLVISNNNVPMKSKLQTTNIIYQFLCPIEHCNYCNKQETSNKLLWSYDTLVK